MFKHFRIFAVIAAIINVGVTCGIIYFIFWCLQHFNIIGG